MTLGYFDLAQTSVYLAVLAGLAQFLAISNDAY